MSESLLDALESIKESKQDIIRLTRQVSPMNSLLDPDRITDYPRRPSPSVSLLSLSSRRSSLSAMSQSSLTSDSSFDASRKPGKKILKNPHRPTRNSKNRVTWKLPNMGDGTGIDSDTMSVDSLESSSSSIYNRARSGVQAARQAWRDFENSPPRGSTGITPIKPIQRLPLTRSSSATGTLHMYSPPGNLATIPQGTVVNDLESKSSDNLTRSKLTPSPLTYNTSSNNSITPGSVLHSTPIRQAPNIRHTQSTSNLEFQTNMQQFGTTPDQTADVDIPILRLDNSNLTDLEESTIEDRRRMHIFQFPQHNQQAILQTPDNSRSKQPVALLEDDDANDYDHLSPLHEKQGGQDKQKRRDVNVTHSGREVYCTPEIIAKERPGVGHSHGGIGSQKTSPSEELPPSIPPKRSRQERKAAVGSEATRILSKPVSASLAQRQSSATRHNTVVSPQTPPPVPPKMRRKKQQNTFPTSGNAKEDPYQRGNQRDEILPPPPEFSTGSQPSGANTSPPQSHGSAEEDLTSSVSNTTLVEEEHTKPMSSRSHHATPSPSAITIYQLPTQQTDTKQSWSMQGIQDRIVEGAEDPGPPVDKRFKVSASRFQSPTHNFKPLDLHHQTSQRRQHYFNDTTSFPGSHSQPDVIPTDIKITPHYSQRAHTQEASRVPKETLTSPTSPRYKISLETALTEGNIMQGVSLKHPVATHQPSERSAVERNQPANRPHQSIPRSNSVGQNSQPAASLDVHLSPEEQEVRKRFYSGGKLPIEKPVVHVKNQSSVTQLLKELEIKDKKHAGLFAIR